MKTFSKVEKEEMTAAAQTAGANPVFDAFWSEVEQELQRMNESPGSTIEPKSTT